MLSILAEPRRASLVLQHIKYSVSEDTPYLFHGAKNDGMLRSSKRETCESSAASLSALYGGVRNSKQYG